MYLNSKPASAFPVERLLHPEHGHRRHTQCCHQAKHRLVKSTEQRDELNDDTRERCCEDKLAGSLQKTLRSPRHHEQIVR